MPKLQQQICLLIKQVRELSMRLKTEEERDFCKVCANNELDMLRERNRCGELRMRTPSDVSKMLEQFESVPGLPIAHISEC